MLILIISLSIIIIALLDTAMIIQYSISKTTTVITYWIQLNKYKRSSTVSSVTCKHLQCWTLRGEKMTFCILWALSRSYCMLFTHKIYHDDPQCLLIKIIIILLHDMIVT